MALFFPEALSDAERTREPIPGGEFDNPAVRFREFTAECLELALKTHSPEKQPSVPRPGPRLFSTGTALGEGFGWRAITLRCLRVTPS